MTLKAKGRVTRLFHDVERYGIGCEVKWVYQTSYHYDYRKTDRQTKRERKRTNKHAPNNNVHIYLEIFAFGLMFIYSTYNIKLCSFVVCFNFESI
jgi:hypothetical protein